MDSIPFEAVFWVLVHKRDSALHPLNETTQVLLCVRLLQVPVILGL